MSIERIFVFLRVPQINIFPFEMFIANVVCQYQLKEYLLSYESSKSMSFLFELFTSNVFLKISVERIFAFLRARKVGTNL